MSHLRALLSPMLLDVRRSLASWHVQLTAIGCLAIFLNFGVWTIEAPDMHYYLRPWFGHLVRFGPVGAFAHPFSDYTPTYLYLLSIASLFHGSMDAMYLIKLLSLAGTAFAALAVGDLVSATGGPRRYALVLFCIPAVVINGAMMGQCDAFWAGACVFAVAEMIRGRTVRSAVWCGIAIAFKLQAIFIAPFIVGALLGRRAPPWQWTVPAIVFVALMIPAWLAGWRAWELAMIYPAQSGSYTFPGSLANPWMFGTIFAPEAAKQLYSIGIAAALAASIGIAALTSSAVRSPKAMLLLALLSSLALPFLLPRMHERYFFLADLLSVALAISYRERPVWIAVMAAQAASLLSLLTYIYFATWPYPALVGALFAAAAIWLTFILARRSGAEWPRLNAGAAPPPLASAERTAA